MDELTPPPKAEFGPRNGLVQEVYYENVSYRGKPTRVFAYFARPEKAGERSLRKVVCLHGRGGKASREWAEHWGNLGYAALAIDLTGRGPDGKPLPDGGPDLTDDTIFGDFTPETAGNCWPYHAVAAVIRGLSLMNAQPGISESDPCVVGHIWGGYIACLVAGIHEPAERFVSINACGHLAENPAYAEQFAKMSPEQRRRWTEHFDPVTYIKSLASYHHPLVTCDLNDPTCPLDLVMKTFLAKDGFVHFSFAPGQPRIDEQGWPNSPKIDFYVQARLVGDVGFHGVRKDLQMSGDVFELFLLKDQTATVYSAPAKGPWAERKWQPLPMKKVLESGGDAFWHGTLPIDRPLAVLVTYVDEVGWLTTSPYLIVEK